MRVALISANVGCTTADSRDFSMIKDADIFILNETNYPTRIKALHPRLQGKIPKMLGYQMYPGYDYYIWIDAGFYLEEGAIQNFVDSCGNYDMCLFKHPYRTYVKEEFEFMLEYTNNNDYLSTRYKNEFFEEQQNMYYALEEYPNQTVYACGAFIYNKSIIYKQTFNLLEQWFYHNCRYSVQDQLSLPYLILKNKGIYNIGILEGNILDKNKYVHF